MKTLRKGIAEPDFNYSRPNKKKAKDKLNRFADLHCDLDSRLPDYGTNFECLENLKEEILDQKLVVIDGFLNQYPSTFEAIFKRKTIIIKDRGIIANLEKKPCESPTKPNVYVCGLTNIDSKDFQPRDLMLITNPFPLHGTFNILLKPYFHAIIKTYNLRKPNYNFFENQLSPVYPEYKPNITIAIATLSMGKESLFNLWKMTSNTMYKKIIIVRANNLSVTINYREREAFLKFKTWFIEKKIDNRVIFEEVESEYDLRSIKKKEMNILVGNEPPKECLVKLQYCLLLTIPLIVKYEVGKFCIPQDYKEPDFNHNEHFSDQPISFNSFKNLFEALLGGSIVFRLEGTNATRKEKVKALHQIGWLKFNSSCYSNARQFINPEHIEAFNMCGNCWKCEIDLPIYREFKLI